MAITITESDYMRVDSGSRGIFDVSGTPYAVIFNTFSHYIAVFKKTNGSFSEQDSSNRPTSDANDSLVSIDARLDGALIKIAYTEYSTTNDFWRVRYVTFDTSSNTWGSPETAISEDFDYYPGTYCYFCKLGIDSGGYPHIAWGRHAEKYHGSFYANIFHIHKTSGGWQTPERITSAEERTEYLRSACMDSTDRFIVIFVFSTNILCRTRSSAGSWDTASTVYAVAGENICVAVDDSDIKKVAFADTAGGHNDALMVESGTSGANPTWSSDGSNIDLYTDFPSIGIYGTSRYVVYFDDNNYDIMLAMRENGSYSTEILQDVSGTHRYTTIENPVRSTGFHYIYYKASTTTFLYDEYLFVTIQEITLTAGIQITASVQAPSVAHTNQYILSSPVQAAASVQAPSVAGTGTASVTMTAAISAAASVVNPNVRTSVQFITMTGAVQTAASVQTPTVVHTNQYILPAPVQVAASVQAPAVTHTKQYISPSPVQTTASVVDPTVAPTGAAPITLTAGISAAASVVSPQVSHTRQYILPSPVQVSTSVVDPTVANVAFVQYITMTAAIQVSATVQAPSISGSGNAPVIMTGAVQITASVVSPVITHTNQYILPSPVSVSASVQAPSISGTGTVEITMTAAISTVASVVAPIATVGAQFIVMTAAISSISSVVAPSISGTGAAPIILSPIAVAASVAAPGISGSGAALILPSPIAIIATVQSPTISGVGAAIILLTPIAVIASVVSPVAYTLAVQIITLGYIATSSSVVTPRVSLISFLLINAALGTRSFDSYLSDRDLDAAIGVRDYDSMLSDRDLTAASGDRDYITQKRTEP